MDGLKLPIQINFKITIGGDFMSQNNLLSANKKTSIKKGSQIKNIFQAVFALRGDKHIEKTVFNIRLRFGIIDRTLNKDDFHIICKDENILFIDDCNLIHLQGVYMWCKRWKAIAVNPKLSARKFLFIAYHELGHHFLHKPLMSLNSFRGQPTLQDYVREAQANYFAELLTGVKYEQLFR